MKHLRLRSSVRLGTGVAICGAALLPLAMSHPASTGPVRAGSRGDVPIKHVVIIMQENRSFDEYFGTFPGADGILMKDGRPAVYCVDPRTGEKVYPYHDYNDVNAGGTHGSVDAVRDVDGGAMDGFLASGNHDVMGYHDAREIPNYWAYARNYVLQDHLFESVASWTHPSHLFLVSAWSANCTDANNPQSCTNAIQTPGTKFAWTDLTYILHKHNVSWGYYSQGPLSPSIVNPLPRFTTVKQNNQVNNCIPWRQFFTDAKNGTLPSVSWVVVGGTVGEHPPAKVSDGQAFVTSVINAVMQGPNWSDSAIFVTWDDWGGFYDHVPPPKVDLNGYGLRVPGFMVSPYARRGFIDHQKLSWDAYIKFIEDIFCNSERLDPATDGRPDPRPTVRENVQALGDLMSEFDFNQPMLAKTVLPPYPGRPGTLLALDRVRGSNPVPKNMRNAHIVLAPGDDDDDEY